MQLYMTYILVILTEALWGTPLLPGPPMFISHIYLQVMVDHCLLGIRDHVSTLIDLKSCVSQPMPLWPSMVMSCFQVTQVFLSFSMLRVQYFFFLKNRWMLSFFKNLFILFIYFWPRWVFVAAHGLSLVVASGGCSSLWCAGFSLRWLLLLWSTGSRRAGFSSCGMRAQ